MAKLYNSPLQTFLEAHIKYLMDRSKMPNLIAQLVEAKKKVNQILLIEDLK